MLRLLRLLAKLFLPEDPPPDTAFVVESLQRLGSMTEQAVEMINVTNEALLDLAHRVQSVRNDFESQHDAKLLEWTYENWWREWAAPETGKLHAVGGQLWKDART